MDLTPGQRAERDQGMALLNEHTARVLEIIRGWRSGTTDEYDIYEKTMSLMIDIFKDFDRDEAMIGTISALSQTLVLLSRTNIFLNDDDFLVSE